MDPHTTALPFLSSNTLMASLSIVILSFLACCASAYRPPAPWPVHLPVDAKSGENDTSSATWAVLVAGSNKFYNYRHQADVCHAYQILKKGGIKEENIIVFMYDDIANNCLNPRPGIIINRPDGEDVYAGVPKDYTGKHVTVKNLFAVLLGDKSGVTGGSGKVVDSKPGDRIFFYYSDHGGPGTLSMPTETLYAKDLIDVLKKKHATGTYKEMVIYVEACESGSMFEGLLPSNLSIYAMTASNAVESSWGTYCPESTQPPPPEYDTCLGDLFSVAWMEDSEKHNLKEETVAEQYEKVKIRTLNYKTPDEGSHVMEYGAVEIKEEKLFLYQGYDHASLADDNDASFERAEGLVNQRDADLYFMTQRYKRLDDMSDEKASLQKEITETVQRRARIDRSVAGIGEVLFGEGNGPSVLDAVRPRGKALVDDWECLKSMVKVFEEHCGALTQYGMKHMRAFANICNEGVRKKVMERACRKVCGIKTYA